MEKAYLVIHLAIEGSDPFPVFSGVGIYSAPALGLTSAGNCGMYADVMYMAGKSYHDAKDNLLRFIPKHPGFAWMMPWLDESYESHKARHDLNKVMKQKISEYRSEAKNRALFNEFVEDRQAKRQADTVVMEVSDSLIPDYMG